MTQQHPNSSILVLAANATNGSGMWRFQSCGCSHLTLLQSDYTFGWDGILCLLSHGAHNAHFARNVVNQKDGSIYERVNSVESDVISLVADGDNSFEKNIPDAAIQMTELHHDHPNQQLEHWDLHCKNEPQSSKNIHKMEPLTMLETRIDSIHDNVHIKV